MKLLGNKIYRKGRKPKKNAYGSIGNRGRGAEAYSSGCCVHPDTRISMADGTTKAAKDIRIGDELMTQAGKGKVEIIANPELGYRSLYSYGRGSYFITGDHPIHADGEWKSLMPGFSKLDYGVECTRLEKGAVLTLINGDRVKLEKIEGETNNPNLVLYDFHMDGDEDANHTYFANGLLVHNGGGGGGGGCRGYDAAYGESKGSTWSTDHSTAQSSAGGAQTTDTTIAAEDATSGGLAHSDEAVAEQQELADSIDDTTITDEGEYFATAPGSSGAHPSQTEAESTPGTDQTPEAQEEQVTGGTAEEQTDTFQEELSVSENLSPMGFENPENYTEAPVETPAEDRPTGQGIAEGVQQFQAMDPLDQQIHQQQQASTRPVPNPFSDVNLSNPGLDPVGGADLTLDQLNEQGEKYNKEQEEAQKEQEELQAQQEQFDEASAQSQEDFEEAVAAQEDADQQALGQREDVEYSGQLQEMWDDPDQRGDLTANEVQRLQNEGYITGASVPETSSGGGGAADTTAVDTTTMTYTADAAADADTQSKLDAGAELSQIDYQNIANMKLEDQMEAQRKYNPNATLAGALNFAQLTGTSPIMHMTEQNFTSMAQSGVGFDELSIDDQKDIVLNGHLPDMSLDAISSLPQKDRDNYWTMKTEQVGGVPKPDPFKDQQGYRNFINMKNEVLDQAMKNDPAFMQKRIEAKAAWAAKKGLNFSKAKFRQLAHGMLSGKIGALAGGLIGTAMGGAAGASAGALAGRYLTSKMIQTILKGPNKEAHKKLNEMMDKAGLTVQQLGQYGDVMSDYEASDEGQAFIDNYVATNPQYQATIDENWNKQNGVTYDPNALDGQGATTAIYGYTDDGIPMTREEALDERGYDWVESRDENAGYGQAAPTTTTGDTITSTSGDPDSLGVLFSDMSPDTTVDMTNYGSKPVPAPKPGQSGGPDPSKLLDPKPPEETKPEEGDDDMKPPSGAPNERWERFMEMMEKRASGEAPSLSAEAMRREREEGLKERMAVMAMGRGQPSAAGLRQYDRAKGTADAELARDASISKLKEQQLAQQQYGDAMSAQLDRESRERQSKYGHDATTSRKQMELANVKEGAERTAWLEAAAGAWKMFGNDIANWIRDGWSEKAAKDAITSQGGTVSGGGSGSPTPPSGSYDHTVYTSVAGDLATGHPSGSIPSGTEWHFEGDQSTGYGVWTLYPGADYGSGYHDGGGIEGPGTETSDDIPALLSDGEFVINARTVRGLGRSQGAKNKQEERERGVQFLEQLQGKFGEEDEVSFGDVIAARRGL